MFDTVFQSEGIEVLLAAAGATGERVRRALSAHSSAGVPGPDPDLQHRHLLAVLGAYLAHYNGHRAHQGRGQRPPDRDTLPAPVVDPDAARVRRRKGMCGLINEYEQAA
jgi:putative transposase